MIFDIPLQGRYVSDVSRDINLINGVYAQVINGAELSSTNSIAVKAEVLLQEGIATCYLNDPIIDFTGFENPFNIISLDNTVNDHSLIGTNVKQNFGRYAAYRQITPSASLSSVISASSAFFTVDDASGSMRQFDRVSIDGEIISVKIWNENKAEIKDRGVGGTVKKFHSVNTSVFGIDDHGIFNDNLYIDSNSDFLYQYRCIAIRNTYENVSVMDPKISLDSNINTYLSKIAFAYEVPVHGNIILSPSVGDGRQSISISTENIAGRIIGGDIRSAIGSAMRFTDASGSVQIRSIININSSSISLDSALPNPASEYSTVEILPAPASNSYQGKISPSSSNRMTSFFDSSRLTDLNMPSINPSRVIGYKDLIYLWIKREVPRNARIAFETSLPLRVKFKIQ